MIIKNLAFRRQTRPAMMVTWSLGDEYGGMTAMCLRRASIFSANGRPSAVITLDPQPELRTRVQRARIEGRLAPEVPVINMHEYYAEHEPKQLRGTKPPAAGDAASWVLVDRTFRGHDGTRLCDMLEDAATGTLRRREYYRPNGTLYLLDFQVPSVDGAGKPRRVLQLYSSKTGTISSEFTSASALYRHWLSEMIGDEEVDVIIDSAYCAGLLWGWEHPTATKTVAFHTTHVLPGKDWLTGPLHGELENAIGHRRDWDGIVMLTEPQADAYRLRFADSSPVTVIGNPVDGPRKQPPWSQRHRRRIVVAGRLAKDKRVEKAIEVVSLLDARGVTVELDIVGNGPHREALEAQVAKLGLHERVHFAGHTADVPARLSRAGFALLCSRFEGQSLALLEAQASGCIPIAFDVDFGPRAVIDSGATGVLVPDGDVAAMADALTRLLENEPLHRRMSRAAFTAARHHNSRRIYRQWQQTLDGSRQHRSLRRRLNAANVVLTGFSFGTDGSLQVGVRSSDLPTGATIGLALQSRGTSAREQQRVFFEDRRNAVESTFTVPAEARGDFPLDGPVDFYVDLQLDGARRAFRLGARKPIVGATPFVTGRGNLSVR